MAIGGKKVTKRELEAQATKEKVFKTAISLFSQYGFDTVTVDDITQHAGVSKGTFYTHFASKDSVLVEQFHQIDNRYTEVFDLLPKETSASVKLRLLIDTMCDYCANTCGVNVMKIVYMNQIGLGEHVQILQDSSDRKVNVLLEEIATQGILSKEFKVSFGAQRLKEYLSRFMRSLLYDWCLCDGSFDLEEEGRNYFNLILKWLCLPQ